MGDRTYVELTILESDFKRAKPIIHTYDDSYDETPINLSLGNLIMLGFEEVNYGDLPFLPELEKAGIPFESCWYRGNDYGEGTAYCRYDDSGEHVPYVLYEDDYVIPIHALMSRLHDYNSLADFIREKDQGLQIIPWDNQEHNAKLFRTKQLINPE